MRLTANDTGGEGSAMGGNRISLSLDLANLDTDIVMSKAEVLGPCFSMMRALHADDLQAITSGLKAYMQLEPHARSISGT